MDAELSWLVLAGISIAGLVAIGRKAGLAMQAAVIALASAVLLLFSVSDGFAQYDPGGDPVRAMVEIMAAQRRGEEVPIRGICLSSCALRLSAGRNLCVSPNAEIGVHEVRKTSLPWSYSAGVRDNLWTGFFEGMLPVCARNLFHARYGFAGGRLAMVSGEEILRACPTIRACTAA